MVTKVLMKYGGLRMSELPEMVKIKKIIQENPFVKTFFLDKKIEAKPGQFVMLWIPRLDEKPFSISTLVKKLE